LLLATSVAVADADTVFVVNAEWITPAFSSADAPAVSLHDATATAQ
jgi:hypothetical protein